MKMHIFLDKSQNDFGGPLSLELEIKGKTV